MKNQSCLLWWVNATLIILTLLILAGGIVRSTGSGLGCPDWPHCFGQWVPPTDVSQLPLDYKTRFQISGREIADFSAFKTWIEYLNRLLGAVTGIFFIGVGVSAFFARKSSPRLFVLSLIGLVLMGLQGFLGAKVVSSHLHHSMITIHMLLALFIFLLVVAMKVILEGKKILVEDQVLKKMIIIFPFIIFLQIILGVQVRESVDLLATKPQGDISFSLDYFFFVHRSFSFVPLLLLVFMGTKKRIFLQEDKECFQNFKNVLGFTGLNIFLGIILSYFGLPSWAQPLHLLAGTLLFLVSSAWALRVTILR
jgi:heme a synthase